MAATATLDLSTLIPERPTIRIDGKLYHLKSPDELSLAESYEFSRQGQELTALTKDANRLPEVEELVRSVSRSVLVDVPDEIFMRLKARDHLAIVEVFTVLLLGGPTRLAGAIARAVNRSTGAK